VICHPGREAGVALIEDIHSLLIASKDNYQIIPVALHHLEQYFNRLGAIVALIFRAVEVISLINEQHPAHRFFEHLPRFRGRVADVLTH